MPRYYFDLHECGTILTDETGFDCATLDEARDRAVLAARDVMSHEVRSGALCLACFIVVGNDARAEVLRVLFRDAVAVTGVSAAPA